jgi:hypothetical protein
MSDNVHVNGIVPLLVDNNVEDDEKFYQFQKFFLNKLETYQNKKRLYRDFDVVLYAQETIMAMMHDEYHRLKNVIVTYINQQNIKLYYRGDPYNVPDLLILLDNDIDKIFDVYIEGFTGSLTKDQIHHLQDKHDSINKILRDLYEGFDYLKTTRG